MKTFTGELSGIVCQLGIIEDKAKKKLWKNDDLKEISDLNYIKDVCRSTKEKVRLCVNVISK